MSDTSHDGNIEKASASYREAERIRFREDIENGVSRVERTVRGYGETDPAFTENAMIALNDIFLELHHRRIEVTPPVKQFEAFHENEVAREAFLIAIVDMRDVDEAADFTRRRMCLTETAEKFFAPENEEASPEP